jgi:cell wall-associated NlpC family hydrolase
MPHRTTLVGALAAVAAVAAPVASASPAQALVTPMSSTVTAAAASKHLPSGSTRIAAVTSAMSTVKPTGAKKVPAKKVLAYRTPSKILATARKYDGGYYRHGGTTPSGFDCSGYTRYVFGKLGRSLPHNAAAQYTVVKHVSRSSARPGDLIFFRSSSGHIYHVGIYAGHGRLYHASEPGRRTGLGTIFSSHVSFGRA